MARLVDQIAAAARGAVERLFQRQKLRLGLVRQPTGDKRLYISTSKMTLPGLVEVAAREHGIVARRSLIEEVRKVAAGYMNAQEEAAKAAVTRVVGQVVGGVRGLMTPETRKHLRAALANVMTRVEGAVERIVDTEATAARNLAGTQAVTTMATAAGEDDPIVFWIITRDGKACHECVSVHTIDGTTPRLWRLSECSRSFHVRGEDRPSLLGIHPSCRCSGPNYLARGYGFDAGGHLKFVALGHEAMGEQRR